MIRLLLACSIACAAARAGAAEVAPPVWSQPVMRSTGDRDADLIEALIEQGRFEEALKICQSATRAVEATRDAAAKWAIRRSQVRTAEQMTRDAFDDAAIASAAEPVTEMLQSYPEHDRRLFLRAQQLAVLAQAARHDLTAAAISPSGDASGERALARLTRLFRQTDSLIAKIEAAVSSSARAEAGTDQAKLTAELSRLKQRLQVDRVAWALMRTELFEPGSRDRIAAAAQAEQLAEEAIAVLPAESAARREVQRLRAEALLRSGQPQQAEEAMKPLRETLSGALDPRLTALQIRIDLALQRTAEAARRLGEYYQGAPAEAPPSADVDLARLEYLLSQSGESGERVGQWIQAIEQRNGSYVRRRAEALALARLGRGGAQRAGDPSLIAAQGRDWLRRGEPQRAGELLAAAAHAETDPDNAIRRATEAAAAWVSADRPRQAAEILAEVSIAHPGAESAAASHLQASITMAEAAASASSDSGDAAEVAELLEKRLRETIRTWPGTEPAASARRWLVKLLVSQNRLVEAAEATTPPSPEQVSEPTLSRAIDLWQRAFRESDPEQVLEIGERFKAALRPLRDDPRARARYRTAGTLLLDPSQLGDLPSWPEDGPTADPFLEALERFRRGGPVEAALRSPQQRWLPLAVWRLMRDAREDKSRRGQIAELIEHWTADSPESAGEPSPEKAERLVWQQKVAEAVAMWRVLASRSDAPGAVLRRAAESLGDSGDGEALAAAVKLWDELAAGLPKGSERWHEAKLAAIRQLAEAGRHQEARRRAQYILLTAPPGDGPLKRQYQSLSQP